MKQRRLDHNDKQLLIKMRGLGFSQEEIAQKLHISQSSVAYQFRNLRQEAEECGLEAVWRRYFNPVTVIRVGGN